MLLMVVERFKEGNYIAVGERFRQKGRMQPEGVIYQASWLDHSGSTCYQLMEAPGVEALEGWMHNWDDLIEFEVTPVFTSAEFWATVPSPDGSTAN